MRPFIPPLQYPGHHYRTFRLLSYCYRFIRIFHRPMGGHGHHYQYGIRLFQFMAVDRRLWRELLSGVFRHCLRFAVQQRRYRRNSHSYLMGVLAQNVNIMMATICPGILFLVIAVIFINLKPAPMSGGRE